MGNLEFTIYKHTVLNPIARSARIADEAKRQLEELGYAVKSITFDVGDRQFTHRYNVTIGEECNR